MSHNIQDIAPFLADIFVDKERDPAVVPNYEEFVKANQERIGPFAKYLICYFHDSWFIKADLNLDTFSITLNDFTTHVLADAVANRKGLDIDHEKLVFPIRIDFEKSSVTYNEVDENGIIHIIEPVELDEYLYEQVCGVDDENIYLAVVAWKDGEPGKHILLLVRTEKISVTEYMDEAWTNLFGNICDDYYRYFKAESEKGRYLSDYHACQKLIDEYDAKFSVD